MLKKILISALITSNFYHQISCSDPTSTLRITFTDVVPVQTQATQTNPIQISNKKLAAHFPEPTLALQINAIFDARNATIAALRRKWDAMYQEPQENLLALAEIESLHGLTNRPEQIAKSTIAKIKEEAHFKALAITNEALLDLLLEEAEKLKEFVMHRYLTKAAPLAQQRPANEQ